MAHTSRTWSTDSADAGRKRVCKACDRCRLKKSKCDGSSPCVRCQADNAICVFGERKKSQDKVYPKGYVEMLEQQQSQLVAGLQEMYRRLCRGQAWPGPQLVESSGHPLTHEILAALNLLEPKTNSSNGEIEVFEDDCQRLQAKLLANGASLSPRRGSFSSESEHSQVGQDTLHKSIITNAAKLRETTALTPSPSPIAQSPASNHQRAFAPAAPIITQQARSALSADPQFYQATWAQSSEFNEQSAMMRGKLMDDFDNELLPDQAFSDLDATWGDVDALGLGPYGIDPFSQNTFLAGPGSLDPMDLDLSRPVRVVT